MTWFDGILRQDNPTLVDSIATAKRLYPRHFEPTNLKTWSKVVMLANPEPFATSVLLIDGSDIDRIGFAIHLKNCSPNYEILEAIDGESGLALYRSRRVDCVVLSLELPDRSGFQVLVDLVPIASRPNVAVLVLTNRTQRGLQEIARQNGAYACFVKQFTSGDDLERAILRAMAFVERMSKEDRYRPV